MMSRLLMPSRLFLSTCVLLPGPQTNGRYEVAAVAALLAISQERADGWLSRLPECRNTIVAVVALANKNTRFIRALLSDRRRVVGAD